MVSVASIWKERHRGPLGGPVGGASDFGSGHHLTVRGFEPRVGLCADSTLLRILSLPPFRSRVLSLNIQTNKLLKIKIKNVKKWGTWVARLVRHRSRGLRVVSSNPVLGSTLAWSLLKK